MLHNYIKSGNVSWNHVLKSLRDADYKNLANKIEEQLSIESTYIYHDTICQNIYCLNNAKWHV